MAAATTLVRAVVADLARHAPFAQMHDADLVWFAERAELTYFARGEVVLTPAAGASPPFFVVKSGAVAGARAGEPDAWLELHAGECFPVGALLAGRAVTSEFRAAADCFCYRWPAADFHALNARSRPFADFCARRIAHLFQASQAHAQAGYSQAAREAQPLEAPLAALLQRAPVTCAPDAPLGAALAAMRDARVGSIVAVDAAGAPLGILTRHDLLDRVVLARADLETPALAVMSSGLASLPPQASAFDAALLMAQRGIRHVLVVEHGRLVGVVSERDLFGLQRLGPRSVAAAIRAADSLAALQACARDIAQLARNLIAQGVAAEQLTAFVTALNDALTARLVERARADFPELADLRFCWLAFGSEGRYEQTLNTDQDNGIVFDDALPADATRARLLPFARRVNADLAACGFPLCSGEIMASNPKWCLSLAEWRAAFARWLDHGGPADLLHATIFFDFRPLWGEAALADALRDWLASTAPGNTRFQHQLAANALANRPPLGWVRDFVTGDDHALDLKFAGLAPFVDAARVFGLASGSRATGTLARLADAATAQHWPERDVAAWREAFLFLQMLRLRQHHAQAAAGQALSNRVDPDRLNELDRRILKEAFRQARKLQARLALAYQL